MEDGSIVFHFGTCYIYRYLVYMMLVGYCHMSVHNLVEAGSKYSTAVGYFKHVSF